MHHKLSTGFNFAMGPNFSAAPGPQSNIKSNLKPKYVNLVIGIGTVGHSDLLDGASYKQVVRMATQYASAPAS